MLSRPCRAAACSYGCSRCSVFCWKTQACPPSAAACTACTAPACLQLRRDAAPRPQHRQAQARHVRVWARHQHCGSEPHRQGGERLHAVAPVGCCSLGSFPLSRGARWWWCVAVPNHLLHDPLPPCLRSCCRRPARCARAGTTSAARWSQPISTQPSWPRGSASSGREAAAMRCRLQRQPWARQRGMHAMQGFLPELIDPAAPVRSCDTIEQGEKPGATLAAGAFQQRCAKPAQQQWVLLLAGAGNGDSMPQLPCARHDLLRWTKKPCWPFV